MKPDYSLYLVTDHSLSQGRSNEKIIRDAVEGGVTCVQYREKRLSTRKMIEEAKALIRVLKPLNIPLIINDRVDVALVSDADGVHLGQSDMRIVEARKILGTSKIIGISAESVNDAIEAEQGGADYIGISPVFLTTTKSDIATPLGLDGVTRIRGLVNIPLVGIGGISKTNVADVIRAGADGVAVVSAIVAAHYPEEAARELLVKVLETKKQKH